MLSYTTEYACTSQVVTVLLLKRDCSQLLVRMQPSQDCRYLHSQGYFKMTNKLLKESFLRDLPSNLCTMIKPSSYSHDDDDTMRVRPDLDTHVFCRALTDLGQLTVDDEGCASRQPGIE